MKTIITCLLLFVLVISGEASSEESFESSEEFYSKYEDSFESDESLALAYGDAWKLDALQSINKLRAKANLPELELSEKLSGEAEMIAKEKSCSLSIPLPDYSSAQWVKDNVAGVGKEPTDTSELVDDAISQWNKGEDRYSCVPITPENDPDKNYYKRVSDYINMMRKDHDLVGFGMAWCDADTVAKKKAWARGVFVARFESRPHWDLWNEQLRNQRQKENNIEPMDISQMVPCPPATPNSVFRLQNITRRPVTRGTLRPLRTKAPQGRATFRPPNFKPLATRKPLTIRLISFKTTPKM